MNETGYSVGVEDIEPGHWVACVLALPGCFSTAQTESQALASVPQAVKNWFHWMYGHAGMDDLGGDFLEESYSVGRIETFHAHPSAEDPNYRVNAFFEADAQPLPLSDMLDGLELLEYSRADLLHLVRHLDLETLNRAIPGDTRFGTIAGILKHVAVTEWWYCDRLGLVENWSSLPDDLWDALETARANTLARLPDLAGDPRITELVGERWSARKLLRRAMWHERDHTEHIRKILTASP